ncbi:MAG TPA: LptF/LptG family permease [Rhizomicrobium sp.]|jgi:lipopolysaccharide export system permease protein|nr:LptF/LptG family permease [Rhizomicrobium sp.]
MPRLSLYVLGQLIGPTALFAFLMTIVVWLTQSLRLLDLVINRGQSAATFVYLTILILPSLLVIILPIAYFAGTLYALTKLSGDSELVVMASAGYSRAQLSVPVMVAAAIVMIVTYLCGLFFMPLGQRAMKEKVLDIRADVGAALLDEGEFNTPALGLTVFIRELNSDGQIRGVMVHDATNKKHPITYLAERGQFAQTPAGARLIMYDGTIEQVGASPAQLSVLKFKSYVFNLDQFTGPARVAEHASNERFLGELLWPQGKIKPGVRAAYFAEANNRLAQPLYCIAFGLIALAVITRGRRARSAQALRITAAVVAAAALRIAGYGIQGLATRHPALCVFFYLIPLAGAGAAVALLAGFEPSTYFSRQQAPEPAA